MRRINFWFAPLLFTLALFAVSFVVAGCGQWGPCGPVNLAAGIGIWGVFLSIVLAPFTLPFALVGLFRPARPTARKPPKTGGF